MRLNVIEEFIGSTLKTTLVCSGATISPVTSLLIDKSEAVVSSVGMSSSGNGFYYAFHSMPGSGQYLTNKVIGVINANTYVGYQLVHVNQPEVD